MTKRVLISDKMSPKAEEVFKKNGIEVDVITGLDKEELMKIIDKYDGLAVRSTTKATEKIIKAATNLKIIGRAGIGVDNIDLNAASSKGIIVMNTPFGNSITTAEHTIAMLMSLARKIPSADLSTQQGKWEKNRFMGVELNSKTLGLIGCGNIGANVAMRALGLNMKIVAFDPFLTQDRASSLGVTKVNEIDKLFTKADFITLHTPLTPITKNIINEQSISKMNDGIYIINCARGGLIDEAALKDALDSGKVAGAALDVYDVEPAKENLLFGSDKVICTPHLGASTTEAQVNVAIQVAEQMSDYLITGTITNAVNFPSISAEEAPKLAPFVTLANQLGLFLGQIVETGIESVKIELSGTVADMNAKAISSSAITGLLKPVLEDINMVSAPTIAKERGIKIEEILHERTGAYENYIRLEIQTERQTRSIGGTLFADGKPRVIQVKGINLETELSENMLYTENNDEPGYIGHLGNILADYKINIASFSLGRLNKGNQATALLAVDEVIGNGVIAEIKKLEHVIFAKRLKF